MLNCRLALLLTVAAASTLLATPQEVSVVISNINGRQPRLAIADLASAGTDAELKSAATTIADVLWHDLEFEEEFYMIPPDVARAVPPAASIDALPVAEWTQRGADYVLMASASRSGGSVTIDVHVISLTGDTARKDVFPKRYTGCQIAAPRACAHAIADSLHKALRNYDGDATSRLAFVSDRAGERASNVLDRTGKEI